MSDPKTKFGKFLKNVVKPIVRAGVKQIPILGTPIAEIVTNMTQPKGTPKKHSTLSIAVQVVIALAVIADLAFNKGANVLAILEWFASFGGQEVAEVSPA